MIRVNSSRQQNCRRFLRYALLLGCISALPVQIVSGQADTDRERALIVTSSAGSNPLSTAPVDQILLQEDGFRARVLSVEPVTEPWRIKLYADAALSRSTVIQKAATAVLENLDAVLAIGTLEIVLADPSPHAILPPTRDPELARPALERLAFYSESEDALRARRVAFLQRKREWDRRTDVTGTEERASPLELARRAVRDEIAMFQFQQDSLLAWLAGERGPSSEAGRASEPRLLLLVNEALGHDPTSFYGSRLDRTESSQLAAVATDLVPTAELGRDLSALGWRVLPFAFSADEIEKSGPFQYNPTQNLPVGFRIRLGRGDRTPDEEEPEEVDLQLDEPPILSLRALATPSGGELVAGSGANGLPSALNRLATAVRVRYSPASDLPLRASYPISLSASGVSVADGSLATLSEIAVELNPESVAAARLRQGLAGTAEGETLELEARIDFDSATVGQSRAELLVEGLLDDGDQGPLRISVGIAVEREDETEIVMKHEISTTAVTSGQLFSHSDQLVLPKGTSTALVHVESANGDWGLAFVDMVDRRFQPSADQDITSLAQTSGQNAIRIEPEDRSVKQGRAVFRAQTRGDVERVEFLLNGQRVEIRNRAPFQARINLGPEASFSEVTAIAFDADGFELDRDTLFVNEPPESFWVRIVEPRPGRRTGRVEVEANVKLPAGERLDSLDFFWGNRRFATLDQPPYRAPVFIPVDQPDGFLRVVANLPDGRSTEDVVLMNRPGFGTQIGVELVELYVVATDRRGLPVRGLERGDFAVLEDGVTQEVETFAVAGDLPLTVGLAIDSSSSLFIRMPEVQRAARDFTRSLIAERDQAFLVEFGSRPQMVTAPTRNLRSILDGISSLEPRGTTPVWEAVEMSLREIEGIPGRKALVVFYDGDDEDAESAYRESLRLARKARVPIYLIVMNNAAARTEGRSFSTRSFVTRLERLARAGGGRVYFVSTQQDLGEIYQAIGEELRSHYLLTYYPKTAAGGPQWREVAVEVAKRGLEARTIEGYGEPVP